MTDSKTLDRLIDELSIENYKKRLLKDGRPKYVCVKGSRSQRRKDLP